MDLAQQPPEDAAGSELSSPAPFDISMLAVVIAITLSVLVIVMITCVCCFRGQRRGRFRSHGESRRDTVPLEDLLSKPSLADPESVFSEASFNARVSVHTSSWLGPVSEASEDSGLEPGINATTSSNTCTNRDSGALNASAKVKNSEQNASKGSSALNNNWKQRSNTFSKKGKPFKAPPNELSISTRQGDEKECIVDQASPSTDSESPFTRGKPCVGVLPSPPLDKATELPSMPCLEHVDLKIHRDSVAKIDRYAFLTSTRCSFSHEAGHIAHGNRVPKTSLPRTEEESETTKTWSSGTLASDETDNPCDVAKSQRSRSTCGDVHSNQCTNFNAICCKIKSESDLCVHTKRHIFKSGGLGSIKGSPITPREDTKTDSHHNDSVTIRPRPRTSVNAKNDIGKHTDLDCGENKHNVAMRRSLSFIEEHNVNRGSDRPKTFSLNLTIDLHFADDRDGNQAVPTVVCRPVQGCVDSAPSVNLNTDTRNVTSHGQIKGPQSQLAISNELAYNSDINAKQKMLEETFASKYGETGYMMVRSNRRLSEPVIIEGSMPNPKPKVQTRSFSVTSPQIRVFKEAASRVRNVSVVKESCGEDCESPSLPLKSQTFSTDDQPKIDDSMKDDPPQISKSDNVHQSEKTRDLDKGTGGKAESKHVFEQKELVDRTKIQNKQPTQPSSSKKESNTTRPIESCSADVKKPSIHVKNSNLEKSNIKEDLSEEKCVLGESNLDTAKQSGVGSDKSENKVKSNKELDIKQMKTKDTHTTDSAKTNNVVEKDEGNEDNQLHSTKNNVHDLEKSKKSEGKPQQGLRISQNAPVAAARTNFHWRQNQHQSVEDSPEHSTSSTLHANKTDNCGKEQERSSAPIIYPTKKGNISESVDDVPQHQSSVNDNSTKAKNMDTHLPPRPCKPVLHSTGSLPIMKLNPPQRPEVSNNNNKNKDSGNIDDIGPPPPLPPRSRIEPNTQAHPSQSGRSKGKNLSTSTFSSHDPRVGTPQCDKDRDLCSPSLRPKKERPEDILHARTSVGPRGISLAPPVEPNERTLNDNLNQGLRNPVNVQERGENKTSVTGSASNNIIPTINVSKTSPSQNKRHAINFGAFNNIGQVSVDKTEEKDIADKSDVENKEADGGNCKGSEEEITTDAAGEGSDESDYDNPWDTLDDAVKRASIRYNRRPSRLATGDTKTLLLKSAEDLGRLLEEAEKRRQLRQNAVRSTCQMLSPEDGAESMTIPFTRFSPHRHTVKGIVSQPGLSTSKSTEDMKVQGKPVSPKLSLLRSETTNEGRKPIDPRRPQSMTSKMKAKLTSPETKKKKK